jgi:hypothetical protein
MCVRHLEIPPSAGSLRIILTSADEYVQHMCLID